MAWDDEELPTGGDGADDAGLFPTATATGAFDPDAFLAKLGGRKLTTAAKPPRVQTVLGKVTDYGQRKDPNADSLTAAGKSAIGKLTRDSLAVSPDIEAALAQAGVSIGDRVRLHLADGSAAERVFDDRTANDAQAAQLGLKPLRGRFDFYSPSGPHPKRDVAVTGFEPVTAETAGATGNFDPDAFLAKIANANPPRAELVKPAPMQPAVDAAQQLGGAAENLGEIVSGAGLPQAARAAHFLPALKAKVAEERAAWLAQMKASLPTTEELGRQAFTGGADPNAEPPQMPIREVLRLTNAASDTPTVTLPKPEGDGVLPGVGRGLATVAEGLTSPKNIALMASIDGAPAVIQKAAAAGFGAMMAKELPQQLLDAHRAETPGDTAQGYTEAAANALMAALSMAHAGGRDGLAMTPEQRAKLAPHLAGGPDWVGLSPEDELFIAKNRALAEQARGAVPMAENAAPVEPPVTGIAGPPLAEPEPAPMADFPAAEREPEHAALEKYNAEVIEKANADADVLAQAKEAAPAEAAPPSDPVDPADWWKTEPLPEPAPRFDPDAFIAKIEAAKAGLEPAPEEIAAAEPETLSGHASADVVSVPVKSLKLSSDVPQFKAGADAQTGVVEPLGGTYDPTGQVLQVWERLNGDREIISGRHRFDLAQRTIPDGRVAVQIHREADGFTAHQAAKLDAELNIRDGNGSTADYANYFRDSQLTEADAEQRGLLARAKGEAGFRIGRGASEDVFALHQRGEISDAQAAAIAEAAPGNAEAQRIGTRAALDGKPAAYVGNLIKAVVANLGDKATAAEVDLFGHDDAAMRQMEAQAKAASAAQKELQQKLSAIKGAAKNPVEARREGVDVKDETAVARRVAELEKEKTRWENWPMHQDLLAKTRELPAELHTEGQALKKRMRRSARGGEGGFIDGSVLEDVAAFGRKLAGHFSDFATWSREMLTRLGAAVRPHLENLWRQMQSESGGIGGIGGAGGAGKKLGTMTPEQLALSERRLGTKIKASGERAYLGAADVLEKVPAMAFLGRAIRRHVDRARMFSGQLSEPFRAWESAHSGAEKKTALAEFERYQKAKDLDRRDLFDAQEGRTVIRQSGMASFGRTAQDMVADMSPAGKKLIGLWGDAARRIDAYRTEKQVLTRDADGKYRAPRSVKDYFPRAFRPEVAEAMANPEAHLEVWHELTKSLQDAGMARSEAEAEELLHESFSGKHRFERMGAVERGRTLPLPIKAYDYSFETARRYLESFSERMAQIDAYGQKTGPGTKDLFDVAMDRANDPETKRYIEEARKQAYHESEDTLASRWAGTLGTAATGLQLGNPLTGVKNILSGGAHTIATLGVTPSVRAVARLIFSSDVHKFLTGAGREIHDAHTRGILHDDLMSIMSEAEHLRVPGGEKLRNFSSWMVNYAGLQKWGEALIRTHAKVATQIYLRDAQARFDAKPNGTRARIDADFIRRNHGDVAKIRAERGSGPATDTFLRQMVSGMQGGYRFDQTPLYLSTPAGKFFFKYQKWGTQAMRNFVKNAVDPLIRPGENTPRQIMPMLRYLTVLTLAGWGIQRTITGIFGSTDRSASLAEILRTAQRSKLEALSLAAMKALNSLIIAGAGGSIANYAQTGMDYAEKKSFKNPLEPPSLSPVKGLTDLAQTAREQRTVTAHNLDQTAAEQVSLYRQGRAILGTLHVLPAEKARQEAGQVRVLARRYADDANLPERRTAEGRVSKTTFSPGIDAITAAIAAGHGAQAGALADALLAKVSAGAAQQSVRAKIQSAIRARQPVYLNGGNETDRENFLDWSQAHLSAADLQLVLHADARYRDAAEAAGFPWHEPTAKDHVRAEQKAGIRAELERVR